MVSTSRSRRWRGVDRVGVEQVGGRAYFEMDAESEHGTSNYLCHFWLRGMSNYGRRRAPTDAVPSSAGLSR